MPTIAHPITKEDPTVSIDTTSVSRLMQMCCDDARKVNPNIKLGIPANRAASKGQRQILQHLRFDLRFVQPQTRAGGTIGGGASGVVEVSWSWQEEKPVANGNRLFWQNFRGESSLNFV